MNQRKAYAVGVGLSLVLAAGSAIAADPPSTTKGRTKGENPTVECNRTELDVARKHGKTAEECNADKARKAAAQDVAKTAAPTKPAATPAKF